MKRLQCTLGHADTRSVSCVSTSNMLVFECVGVVIPVTVAHKDVNTHTPCHYIVDCWHGYLALSQETLRVCLPESKQWVCKAPRLQQRRRSRERSEQCFTSYEGKKVWRERERAGERGRESKLNHSESIYFDLIFRLEFKTHCSLRWCLKITAWLWMLYSALGTLWQACACVHTIWVCVCWIN